MTKVAIWTAFAAAIAIAVLVGYFRPPIEGVPAGEAGKPIESSAPPRPDGAQDARTTTAPVASRFGFREGGARRDAAEQQKRMAATPTALNWLASTQEEDGHWDAVKHGGTGGNSLTTGLVVLAFHVHGSFENSGRHKDAVARGLRWIVDQQSEDGRIGGEGDDALGHAICAAALCEAYSRARSDWTKRAAIKAIDYSCRTQRAEDGGWSKSPDGEASLAVTQWFIIQLKLASGVGLEVPEDALSGARRFLETVTTSDAEGLGTCSNTPGGPATPKATASALFCWQLLGRKRTDPVLLAAADYLLGHLPVWEEGRIDFAYWYSGAQAAFVTGGKYWKALRTVVRDMFVDHMIAEGPQAGSWDPVGVDCDEGGRVYATAMAVMSFHFYHPRGFPSNQ